MKKLPVLSALLLSTAFLATAQAVVITVTTTNNISPAAGQTSLAQALGVVKAGDTIQFNIPGAGPHYIATPPGGYPLITNNNVTIDGYSQPGSSANTNSILAPNNAKIKIVLDSRNGNYKLLDFAPTGPTDQTGYGDGESAILGVLEATGVHIHGLGLIGVPLVGPSTDIALYAVSFAKGASGHVSGCWIGVDLDGKSLFGFADGITGFRYRVRNASNTVLSDILVNDLVIGVKAKSTNAPSEFNVITGIPAIPIIIEGNATRISGNFLSVLPDGLHDFNPAFDPVFTGKFEGNIEIGRGGNNAVIGTDGDGVNDANERNVIGGAVPKGMGGYPHNIEFYGQTPGTNIVVAGNFIGVGIDGVTRFTNGVPVLNAAGGSAQYRFGSDFDGVSDDVEANVVFNNWPTDLFPPGSADPFFDELSATAILSARGNVMVNNNPFPVSPVKSSGTGTFYEAYYAKALADVSTGVVPVLSTNSSITKLVGRAPIAGKDYPTTIIDLYAVDPEGVTFGQTAGVPELPNGYIQGRSYIGSFVEGSAADLNTKPGEFEFDLSKVELKGSKLTVTANYSKSPAGTRNAITLTSPFSDPVEVTFTPGSVQSVGLRHIVTDTVVINQSLDSLGNWEPYASVLGNSVFLIEGNAFADGTTDSQRYVVALQPAAGGAMKLGEGVFADNGSPFKGVINASRQNGNPGRVAGDPRPGAVNFVFGGETSPHVYPEFQSDNRWKLGFDRLGDGRYATVQSFKLDPATLAQTSLSKILDSANGRLTSGDPQGNNQISRFGGELAFLSNGNFVSVVEDRSKVRNPNGNCAVATIFAPDGSIVKESFKVADGDIWSNATAYQGGFAVRVAGIIYFYDNAGTATGQVDQNTSSALFDRGRGDGTRLAGHVNSPYVYLTGKVTDGPLVRLAVWDSRTRTFVAITDASEGAFTGGFDRATLSVDALDRITVAWVSQPAGYEAQQVAARVLSFNGTTKAFTALTKSFLPFVNAAKSGGIRTFQMSVATTTRQILVAAKGEINLQNNPSAGANSPRELNFYAVISHPDPKDDPTPAATGPAKKNFTTTVVQASGASWTGAIWNPGPVAPSAGNTYEALDNGAAFGNAQNNTRLRNPATAGVQTFPGDSLTLNKNTELRAKQAGAILNFPGVGGSPGLILNGGVLNAGDDTVFVITGKVQVASTSYIVPADQGGGAVLQPRGFNIAAQLSGSGSMVIYQAGTNVAQEISGSQNTFTGDWIVKAGWLKGSGVNSLGTGNITIDPKINVNSHSSVTNTEGPALFEVMYDINSPGKLILVNGGRMILHQKATFKTVAIEGTTLSAGAHPYSELVASFPNNFAPGGSGSIIVGAPSAGGPVFNRPTVSGGNLTISWTGAGKLQEAANVTGPWTDVAGNPNGTFTVQTIAGARKFYRLLGP
jgi:hypothetical protein